MNANRHLDNGLNRNSSKSEDEGRGEGSRLVQARVIVSTKISRRDKMSLLFVIHIYMYNTKPERIHSKDM